MLAAIKAFLGIGSGIGWIAYAVTLGLGILAGAAPAYVWEHRATTAATSERDAAKQMADLARQDAQRWHEASDSRDQALQGMHETLDRQNAAVERLQFSLDRANGAAAKAQADTRSARDAFERRIREMEDEAHAHPNQVMPLGPIVRGRVDRLWD